MHNYPPTIIWRHRRENLKKCSLRGLEKRSDMQFFKYPGSLPDLSNYLVLALDAPILTQEDSYKGLFIVDATWRYAQTMLKMVQNDPQIEFRSLPTCYKTAYPRRQEDCPEPDRGLASIEAIYLSYLILGRNLNDLLNDYYWKDSFLDINRL